MERTIRISAILILTLAALFSGAAVSAAPVQAAGGETYIVLYNSNAVSADAASAISRAGGQFVYAYDKIGVAIARSSSASFSADLAKNKGIEGISATTHFASQLKESVQLVDAQALAGPGTWGDPLSKYQWDMTQIHVPEAYAVTGGSPSVVVGDIDTGLDYTHPDLAANVDFSNSVSCLSGAPDTNPAAWMDENGHGTHTAGTIAAAQNGVGIVGAAPNVKVAGIRAGNADGYFFPEAVICAFMWAGSHKLQVTNNSYFADPWLFNCRNDAGQRAIWKAEQRAINYAINQGVTVVAAMGNENMDLSKQNVDSISPDDSTPVTREVTNACVEIPVEIPGVVGVTGDGQYLQKTYYSNYGVGVADVTAPGGDYYFQNPTGEAPYGLILSTVPGGYAFYQGTSMASPHVAGVAALILSQFPKMQPGAVRARLQNTADPMACPSNPFDPAGDGSTAATCQGGSGYNGFYGKGQVNALTAVTAP